MNRLSLLFVCVFLTFASSLNAQNANRPPNILLFIGDDIGVEALKSYGVGSKPAKTPNLDKLASEGVSFTQVWSQAACSPTRATIMTGRYGFRTGIGMPAGGPGVEGPLPANASLPADAPIEHAENLSLALSKVLPWSVHAMERRPGFNQMRRIGLPSSEVGVGVALKQVAPAYRTAAIGKWHLSSIPNGWLHHPRAVGFDYFSIIHGNATPSYFAWQENTNGEAKAVTGYTPDDKANKALAWINEQGNAPWFLWYAFTLPHSPYFVPPSNKDLAPAQSPTTTAALPNSREYFDALVEEMDRKIGEVLEGLPKEARENTVVIFVGDNGSSYEAIDEPFIAEQSKFSLFQGGIHVPLIIAGKGFSKNSKCEALVNTTDLFATVLDLACEGKAKDRVSVPTDSVSLWPYLKDPKLKPIRKWAYADRFLPMLGIAQGDYAIRDTRYKLIGSTTWNEFYDLQVDPYERTNLLEKGMSREQETVMQGLQNQVATLHKSANKQTPGLKKD